MSSISASIPVDAFEKRANELPHTGTSSLSPEEQVARAKEVILSNLD